MNYYGKQSACQETKLVDKDAIGPIKIRVPVTLPARNKTTSLAWKPIVRIFLEK